MTAEGMLVGADKVQHFFACFVISLAAYAVLALSGAAVTPTQRAVLAGVAGMTAGVVKELGDLENLWPPPYLCRPSGCDFEWMDLAADLAGVLLALLAFYFYAQRRSGGGSIPVQGAVYGAMQEDGKA